MSGVVSTVLASVQAGAVSVEEVTRDTGLARDRVSLALDTLTRLGLVEVNATSGCPTSGCVTCVSACQLTRT